MGVGWDMALIGLVLHLSSGQPVNAQAIAAWMTSAPGREFVTLSSRRWRDADVAAGTDETAAQAAADRTLAAYTADPGRRPAWRQTSTPSARPAAARPAPSRGGGLPPQPGALVLRQVRARSGGEL